MQPRKQPIQDRARETVEAILEATARLLVEEGYERTSTNRVAKTAGVSVGSLYQYFPNKQALVLAVARRHHEEMLGLLQEQALDFDAPVAEAVPRFVRTIFEAHEVDPDLHRVLFPLMMQLGLEHFDEHQFRILAVVRTWLERHRMEVRPDDLDTAAFVLVASVESAVHASYLDYARNLPRSAVEAEITALVLRYLI